MTDQPTPEPSTLESTTQKRRPRRPRASAPVAEPAVTAPEAEAPAAATTTDLAVVPEGVHALGRLDAGSVGRLEFRQGAIGGVRATDVTVRMAAVGGIAARAASVRQGFVRAMLAQDVHVQQSFVRSLVANTVHTGPTSVILVALARRIDGEAKVLLDWRGALAFGAGLGAVLGLLRVRLPRRR